MNGIVSRRRSAFAGLALRVALGTAVGGPLTGYACPASAQSASPSAEELKAARELFQEAFKAEQENRYAEALDKFQRVAKVKQSASVRYRIATVLAAMGRLREARDMYRALAAAKPSLPPNDQEIADSAAEKAADLDRRIPKLALRVQDNPPEELRVTVDGAPVPVSTTPRSIELDPGDHVVAASARNASPSEQTLSLRDGGGEVSHTVTIAPTDKPIARPVETPRDNTLAWIAVGGGGLLLAVGGGLLLAREGAIDDISANCPLHLCPESKRSDVESDRDRAELLGPLGVGLGIAGLAAIGVGVYWLVKSPPRTNPTAAGAYPLVPTGRGLILRF